MFQYIESHGGTPIKAWTRGVAFDDLARDQLKKVAALPFVHRHVAVMPDVHAGIGATVGTVVATRGAIVPAAVGVDIGCGMAAVPTSLRAEQLPDSLRHVRSAVERHVPHGGPGEVGSWEAAPEEVLEAWLELETEYRAIVERHGRVSHRAPERQLGTLGTGNHFIELCLDEEDRVWIMLHSGSRGAGNKIGSFFTEAARRLAQRLDRRLPDRDLGWFADASDDPEEQALYAAYVQAVGWAQRYAAINRRLMLGAVVAALRQARLPDLHVDLDEGAVSCHHNYVQRETHFGEEVWVTRKGAVRAGAGELGIIPGSMGARSYIVRGKGNAESFCSCSHGAGRTMSRGEAKRRFTLADHARATEHVECRKDKEVLDETPMAYKDIDAVMKAQADLVEVVHTLRQVVCVKG